MIKTLAKIVSYIFHPLLLFYYLTLLTYWINPYAFRLEEGKALGIMRIMSFFILIFFPLISTALMKGLKMISSFTMEDKQDRIGPMIATIVFYIWFFINIKNDPAYPLQLGMIALGGTISLCLAFFINNFSKISLHTVGAGAFMTGMFILINSFSASRLLVKFWGDYYQISHHFLLAVVIIIAGLIGSSRLILEAHKKDDLYGGYVVGIVAILISYKIMV